MYLGLGTVQLGMDYGISKKPSLLKSQQILDKAIEKNIKYFDTAQSYGNSENILSHISNNYNINIITKINCQGEGDISSKINKSLDNLNTTTLDGVLFHDFKQYLNYNYKSQLIELKKNGVIKKIGVSIYNIEEGLILLNDDDIDIIQLPFNYLDHQWINNSKFMELIETTNKDIYIRSIFLQGILINDFQFWPFQNRFETIYQKISDFCNINQISKIEMVVKYIKYYSWINVVLVGIDNLLQLEEITKLWENTTPFSMLEINNINHLFSNISTQLTNPSLWTK